MLWKDIQHSNKKNDIRAWLFQILYSKQVRIKVSILLNGNINLVKEKMKRSRIEINLTVKNLFEPFFNQEILEALRL